MKNLLVILCTLLLVTQVWCTCPLLPPHSDFDPYKQPYVVVKFLGHASYWKFSKTFTADWYVTRMKRMEIDTIGGIRCVHVQLFEDPGDHLLHGNVTGVEDNGMLWQDEGKFQMKDPSNPGRMTLTTDKWQADLTILSTDYDDFAVYYMCTEKPDGGHMTGMGIMGRNHQLPPEQIETLRQVLVDLDLNTEGMVDADCDQ